MDGPHLDTGHWGEDLHRCRRVDPCRPYAGQPDHPWRATCRGYRPQSSLHRPPGRGRHAQLEPNAPRSRDTYRRTLDVDDATWQRGRGSAIIQAIVALPYYVHTNPIMAATARHTLKCVLK